MVSGNLGPCSLLNEEKSNEINYQSWSNSQFKSSDHLRDFFSLPPSFFS